jgi:hypothetical protein
MLDALLTKHGVKMDQMAWKKSGGYMGSCRIRGVCRAADGTARIIVGYRIEGGEGEILHIQHPKELTISRLEYDEAVREYDRKIRG